MDDCDDLLAMAGLGEKKNDTALKALNATLSKMQQRKEKQQEDKKRLRRQAEDLQASMEAKDDVTGLAAQTRHMEDMRARVVQELDKGDADTGGVEPDVWQQALYPVQALPEIQLADLPELQQALQAHQQLLGLTDSSSSSSSDPQQLLDTFAWLLSEMGPLEACPSEAAARATFYAACYGPVSVAVPAATRFMAWCGEPEVVAGCELMGLSQLCLWSGGAPSRAPSSSLSIGTALADSMTPVTIRWLPSAGDVLAVLAALGYKPPQQQQQQQQRPAKQQKQQQQLQQEQQPQGPGAYRREHLQTLLHLLGRIARGYLRLDAAGLASNTQHYVQLLLALLALMLDQGVRTSCRFAVVEAFAALLDLAPDSTWDRLVRDAAPGSLLAALSGGLGPSHRASVALLGQMPRSSRGTQLRQLGALQLLSKLIPGAKQQVPPSRISGMSASELRAAVHRDVQALLGSSDRLRALLNSLCVPPVAGGTLQVWLLMSVLEAADLVLWVDVSTPGVGIGKVLCQWLLEWLKSLDRVLDKKLSSHRVRSKVAALENAYTFSELGCVVACADAQAEEW